MKQEELFPDEELLELGEIEAWCIEQGYTFVIGVDEAGRGPLAGPVYAAAVALFLDKMDEPWVGKLNDSKKLKEKVRLESYEDIKSKAMGFAVAVSDEDEIDDINILQASLLAMKRAVEEVVEQIGLEPDCVFVDGNKKIDVTYNQQTIVKGDSRSRSVAAASILAKTDRDALLLEMDSEWPEYGFASHKGYGTKKHREAIIEFGPCVYHRKSFAGVREHLARLRKEAP